MSAPAVSVIIPTRNRAALLEAAIESVRKQTFGDWELIVIDDGSDDGTAETVRRLEDPRIRLLRHEEQRGAAAARNTGLSHATGALLAFLDDDDEWFSDKLERQLKVFRQSPPGVGLVYGSIVTVDRWSGKKLGRKVAEVRGDVSRRILQVNVIGGMSSVVIRRECFEKVGNFDETMSSLEDYDLFIRIGRCFLFDFVEADVVAYSFHSAENQISRNPKTQRGGIDVMGRKYRRFLSLRRKLSVTLWRIGVRYCWDGSCPNGRSALLGAIRLYPFSPRYYLALTLSLFGTTAFRAAGAARRRVLSFGRPAAPPSKIEGRGGVG